MKRIMAGTVLLLLCGSLLAGCFGTKSVTFTHRPLTEDEQQLIYAAGGVDALHFTSEKGLPAGETIQLSLEQFEQGNFVATLGETAWIGGDDRPAHIGFGVQPADDHTPERLLFSGTEERLMPELEAMPGGSALAPAFEKELVLKKGEAAVLAYYIVSASGRVETVYPSDEDMLARLQENDRCLLVKAEWPK
ncbi:MULTISPECIES: hypothetical protein [Sporosarcina]|uniref:hypothetical protein n=1 Tax=Sporosarcina TaxID=1569 RepID=UPI000B14006B|nr:MULTISPECIES: hypothetical protein [Sporosarcina]WJY27105.1 hypothetical protein QWT68_13805 [Sporosarcina sp. 0.2-SM1T-5]